MIDHEETIFYRLSRNVQPVNREVHSTGELKDFFLSGMFGT